MHVEVRTTARSTRRWTHQRLRKGTSHGLQARAQAPTSSHAPVEHIDWENLTFSAKHVAPYMFVATTKEDGTWEQGEVLPFGPLEIHPAANVLNYGQSVFEGMKAYRSVKGRIVTFRPTQNANRMQDGAKRLVMALPPQELFLRGVEETVKANSGYVPPEGKGSLYIRPLLFGSGPILGLGPAPAYTFLVYCAPVGAYFKGGGMVPIDLLVEDQFHRAAPGGMGGTKAAGNYSPVLVTQLAAKKEGYADVIYLDAKEDKYVEEVSSCNIFSVKGRKITTPALRGTILPGITRKSILQLAESRGYEVEEKLLSIEELLQADEVFTTGTAVVVSAVGSITYKGKRTEFQGGGPGTVAQEMLQALTNIQVEESEDPFGWVHPVC